jgi:hypothetical protein
MNLSPQIDLYILLTLLLLLLVMTITLQQRRRRQQLWLQKMMMTAVIIAVYYCAAVVICRCVKENIASEQIITNQRDDRSIGSLPFFIVRAIKLFLSRALSRHSPLSMAAPLLIKFSLFDIICGICLVRDIILAEEEEVVEFLIVVFSVASIFYWRLTFCQLCTESDIIANRALLLPMILLSISSKSRIFLVMNDIFLHLRNKKQPTASKSNK